MPTPSVLIVLSPHQNAFFVELADLLSFELAAAGVRVSVLTEPHLHVPAPDEVYVLLPPHEYVALEGEAWLSDPALCKRTIGISAEQPHQGFFRRNGEIAARLGAHFDFSTFATDEYRAQGLGTSHLAPGYTAHWDRGATPMAERSGPDVLYFGNSRPRRLSVLGGVAAELAEVDTRLLITDYAFPKTSSRPSFLTGEPKRDLLARTKLVLNIHQSDEQYFEWLRFIEAAHCGAAMLTEQSVSTAPFTAGHDFESFRVPDLGAALRRLTRNPDRLDELVGNARATLQAHPFAESVARLVEVAQSLVDGAVPAALPARIRAAHLGPADGIDGAPASTSARGADTRIVSFADWQRTRASDVRVLIAPEGFKPLASMQRLVECTAPLAGAVVAGRDAAGADTLEGWTPWEPWRLDRGQHLGRLLLVDAAVLTAADDLLRNPALARVPWLCAQIAALRLGLTGDHVASPVGVVHSEPLDPEQRIDAPTAELVSAALAAPRNPLRSGRLTRAQQTGEKWSNDRDMSETGRSDLELAEDKWDKIDIQAVRSVSWMGVQVVSADIWQTFSAGLGPDVHVAQLLAQHRPGHDLVGAALVCGDMQSERIFFEHNQGVTFQRVDGYDLSQESLDRYQPDGPRWVPHKVDCNALDLPAGEYDLVVASHGAHHVMNLSGFFAQARLSLKPGGLMYMYEWIGPTYLRVPRRNHVVAALLLLALFPSRSTRLTHMGKRKSLRWMMDAAIPEHDPSEACNSPQLYDQFHRNFDSITEYRHAALSYPMFEGISQNLDQADPKVQRRLRLVVKLERWLTAKKLVQPLFVVAVGQRKP